MKKFGVLFLVAVIFFSFPLDLAEALEISAESTVVMCADSKEIIYSKNMSEQRTIASTTKILTAVIAIESGRLDETVTVGDEILGVEGTLLGLEKGDTIDLYSLVLAMLLSSGNDAANAVAVFVGGTVENFAVMMNEKAKEIGMENSSFVTPSGLDADNHYSTALDMAYLACYALNLPDFCEIVKTQSARIEFKNGKTLYVTNHNKLIGMYEGCIGIKTGYTKSSGRCLVSAVERDGSVLVAVTLNAPDDWDDHTKLYDYAFDQVSLFENEVSSFPEIKVVGGEQDAVLCVLSNRLTYTAVEKISGLSVEIYVSPFIYAPVCKGDILGEVKLVNNGEVIASAKILAENSIEKKHQEANNGFFDKIKNILTGWLDKWKN